MPPPSRVVVLLLALAALAPEARALSSRQGCPRTLTAQAEQPFPPSSPRGQRVLVVDADPSVALLLGFCIRDMGYVAVSARTVADAEVAMHSLGFQGAFVAERVQTEGDGLEFARSVRDEWHLPVVVLGERFVGPPPRLGFPYLAKPLETRAVWRAFRTIGDASTN